MADANTAVESSTPAPFVESSLEDLTEAQYAAWQKTGTIDRTEAKPEKSPTSTKTIEAPPEGGEPKGNQETGKGKNLETRKREVGDEVQELEKLLARKADLKRQLEEPAPGKETQPKADEPKPAELKAPEKPKADNFKTWEEYETARDKYFEDVSDYKVKLAIQEDRAQRANEYESRTIADRWNKQVEATAKDVGLEEWNKASAAIAPLLGKDPRMQAAAAFVLESEIGTRISHYLGTHLDEAEAIAKLPPIKQIRELTLIENSLTKPAKADKKETPPPGPKSQTEVPPPPTDLGARNTPNADPVQTALKNDDVDGYIRAANAADLANKRRPGRR